MSRNPLNALWKFLGHGPAPQGAHHWRAQRLGAMALIPLTVWFLVALVCLPDYGFDTLHAWVAAPWRAVLISLLVFCIAWHSQLGVQVVIEDYVHGRLAKPLALGLSALGHILLGAVGVFAVLHLAFKG